MYLCTLVKVRCIYFEFPLQYTHFIYFKASWHGSYGLTEFLYIENKLVLKGLIVLL